MVNLAFRWAIETDLPAIIALLADDFLGVSREETGDNHRQYIDAFHAVEKDPNQFLAVAVLDGSLVGALQLSFIPGLSRSGIGYKLKL